MTRTHDIAVVYGITAAVLIAGYLGLFAPLGNYLMLVFTLAIFGLPTAYLLYRNPGNIKNVTIAAFLFGVLYMFSFDFVATYTNAWAVDPNILLFPGAILGVVNLDDLVWFFFWVALVIAFYEQCIERHKEWRVSPHVWLGVALGVVAAAGVVLAYFFAPALFGMSHAFLVISVCAIVPLGILFLRPHLIKKVGLTTLFFLPIYLGFDLVALANGWWSFDGNYIGGLVFFEKLLPWEEIVSWIVLGGGSVALYDELFLDDGE